MAAPLNPFELLLNVCTREREALDAEKRAVQDAKKSSRKRHGSSELLSFEEIKALSSKALVEKYSKLTSDEMNKKYSYQCRLLPGKCNDTFKSYGNERKAWEKMKLHLNTHLKLHSSEIAFSVFAKSPSEEEKLTCSNALQKSPKKMKMEPQPSSSSDSNVGYEPSNSRRVNSCPAKKMLEFNGSLSHKPVSRRKKNTPKPKSKLPDRSKPFLQSLEYPPYDDDDQNESPYEHESRPSYYSSSSASEDSQSSLSSVMDHLDNVWSTLTVSSSSRSSYAKPRVYLPDHDYAEFSGIKFEPTSDDESEIFVPHRKSRRKIQKQFIIPTPKFPYLHAPEPYVVTQIVEIDALGNTVKTKQHEDVSCLDINKYVLNKVKEEKFRSSKPNFDLMLPVYKAEDVTGSVLECVENKVNTKYNSGACSSKFKSYPSTSKDENSEFMKFRREQAIKHIAHLTSKRKKAYQGPLQCQLCMDGRNFTAVASLMHHYRSHAGIKLFVCNICNDTFTRQHSLNYHMMIHQNQSRFCCEFCQRNFRHPSHFKEHLRRHTGETPFQCSFCNMLFKTRNTFKRHLRMQHKKILTAHGIEDDKSEGPSCRKTKKSPQ